MPDLPFRIVVTDSGTAVVQRFGAAARKVGGVGRTVGRTLSRGFSLAQGAITGAVSRVFNLRNALLGLGVGLAIRKIVTVFGGFQREMNLVRVLTSATAEEFENLTEQAKTLGITTQFSAQQAAEGMSFLAKAGLDANEVMSALPDTLTLAAASSITLAESADIVTGILAGLEIPMSELKFSTDVLVQAFTSAKTDVRELGQAFKFVGPIAVAAGLTFIETTAALQVLAQGGIAASMAGTTLRRAIGSLLNPSKEAQKILDSIGASVKTADGQLRPLAEILDQLGPIANDAGAILKVFGQRAGSGMAVLLRKGSASLLKFSDDLENSAGRAAEVAAARMQGLTGVIIKMRSAIAGAVIEIGDQLAPTLINAAEAIALFGRNTAIAFQGISETSKTAGDASTNAFLNIIPSAELLVRAINFVRKAWIGLSLTALIVERAYLETLLFLNRNVFGPIRTALINLGGFLARAFEVVKQNVAGALAFLIGKLAEFAAASARAARALPTDAAKEVADTFLTVAISARLAQAQLKNVAETSSAADELQKELARSNELQSRAIKTVNADLRANAQAVGAAVVEIDNLDRQTNSVIAQIKRTTAALKNQTQATKDMSAATKQATADAKKAAQAFKSEIGAFLAFDIDPSTGFGELQSQLATIGPNAVKAGVDFEAAFEKIRASSATITPEQFDVFQQQSETLRELIRIGGMLPESIRQQFDQAIPAVIAGQASITEVTKQALEARRRLQLANAAQNLSAAASLTNALGNLAESGGEKNFETVKKFRIAEAIINGAAGVSRAFAELPFPLAVAAAAAIAINTIAQVRKIQATQPGGGGGGGGGGINLAGGGGGGGAPPGLVVPAEPAEQDRGQRITISVAGFIGNEAELASQLSNLIREAQGDGVDFALETSRG
jgi:TP901 family phage tail tape measure protein